MNELKIKIIAKLRRVRNKMCCSLTHFHSLSLFPLLCCRAATIVLKENNCHLLRVDKEHFNRILRDVEANTLRLQEHGKDVLVLERVAKQRGQHSAFK